MNYIAEANLTLSNKFHGEKVTLAELRSALQQFADAGNRLDKIKKAIFYGKGEDVGLTQSIGAVNCIAAPYMLAGVPITAEAISTGHAQDDAAQAEIFIHGIIGKATEAAELIEALQAAIFGERELDKVNVLEEIGDGFWYDAILLQALGYTFEAAQYVNIAKLRKRFPNAFTEHDAINRDTGAEREVLNDSNKFFSVDQANADMQAVEMVEHETAGLIPDVYINSEHPARFHTRCPGCGLTNGQHRPKCPEGVLERAKAPGHYAQDERAPFDPEERNGE
jgi:hypothetical protein